MLTFESFVVMFVEQKVLTILEFYQVLRFFRLFGSFSDQFFCFGSDLFFDTRFRSLFLDGRAFGN